MLVLLEIDLNNSKKTLYEDLNLCQTPLAHLEEERIRPPETKLKEMMNRYKETTGGSPSSQGKSLGDLLTADGRSIDTHSRLRSVRRWSSRQPALTRLCDSGDCGAPGDMREVAD